MQFYYGEKMPLRLLDEAEFWKRQEQEHTVVIRKIVGNLEPEFVRQLQDWEQALAQTEATVAKYIETVIRSGYKITPAMQQQITGLIEFALDQSQKFILLLNRIATGSKAVRDNLTALIVINHIRRESESILSG